MGNGRIAVDKRTAPQNTRNTNIEWLRIVSMLLIVAYHAASEWGGIQVLISRS